jgi:hypothetical protein
MNKNKLNTIIVFGLILSSSSILNAASYKGQKIYTNTCKECHGSGQEFAKSFKITKWEKMIDEKGSKLKEIHSNSKKAQPINEYFEDKKWQKESKHIRDFFVEYAKDSGNVPACN